ncbi:MAG: FAD-dependent oxidoreductase, partial [Candidatus Omnitrophica bacterium]|nr:FAD-dependent oxidoreductase [Candidatus Omnitrophota bacterium]
SVYAARKRMRCLVITKDIGGQTAWSGEIENYTGYQFISGVELAAKFEEHMRKYSIEVKEGEEVIEVRNKDSIVLIKTDKGEYETKTAIIASGKKSRELGVPGEQEFKNKGLTYCATCDGPLFTGKDVAVIGGGNSALDATLQLMNIAKRVYLINITSGLTGDQIMAEKIKRNEKVSILNNARVTAILGEKLVKSIKIEQDKNERNIAVGGVFVEIGLTPNSGFANEVDKNKSGEIKVNCHNETNVSAIFAAGDVTDVPEKQIIIAAGEGAKACLSAFKYLAIH